MGCPAHLPSHGHVTSSEQGEQNTQPCLSVSLSAVGETRGERPRVLETSAVALAKGKMVIL